MRLTSACVCTMSVLPGLNQNPDPGKCASHLALHWFLSFSKYCQGRDSNHAASLGTSTVSRGVYYHVEPESLL